MCSWGSGRVSMILLMLIYYFSVSSSVSAQDNPYKCTSNGNYTSNSTYSANLNALLRSLSLNMSDNGFYTSSVGQTPNTANALALCRADLTLAQCRSCVESATREVLLLCPNERQAAIWYPSCTLRYSSDPIDSTQTADPTYLLRNTQNVSDGDRFREERATLLGDLTAQAANGSSALKVGAGSRTTSASQFPIINGLVQCTPDLSSAGCSRCLGDIGSYLQSYISQGFRVLGPNCNIRYELYSFYNETRLRELRVLPPLVNSPPPATSPPVPGSNDNNTRPGKKDDTKTKVILIIVVPVGVTLIFAACAIIFMRKRMKRRAYEITETGDDISAVESLQFDFSSIRAATTDFDDANKLGQGGFGAVYKGKLQTGEEIAVKRLSKDSGQGNAEFKNEVMLVAKLQHRNLVRLLGFSMEGTERVLVYEFVENASLDQFIFDPVKRPQLDWDKRFKIITGIAKGILYLHEDSRLKIIHRDLKASNVLLDGDMNPKIADFGMARLFKPDETQGNTSKIVGTYGYMSPEYAMHGQFSIKSDVFSFGVLVLEIVSGQRNVCIQNGENVEDLLTLTWKNWREGTAANVIDPVLTNGAGSIRDMMRCIHMGLLCVQENAANRPTMAEVALMLSSSTMTLPVPSEPAFYMASRYGPMDSAFQKYDSKDLKLAMISKWTKAPKWTILVLSILLRFPSATSQPNCAISGETFASNSTYEANLNALITSLSSDISSSGFLNASVGQSPDRVNAIVLCRGDISLQACRECVSATAPATVQQCPNRKDAIFWNETCMVRYSSQPIFGKLETQPVSQIPSIVPTPNPQRHDQELTALLESLRGYAANGSSFKKVAAGNRTAPDEQPIYALEQCTPDLSATDCTECLTRAIDDIPTCCSGIIGAGVLRPSCTLRFENYRFYSASMFEVPQEPFTEKKGSNTTVIIVAVSVSISVFVMLLFFIAILLRRRKMKQKPQENVESPDEVSTDVCQQYDLGKIRAATNDFSADNKLGEGGFGTVYKGRFPNGQEVAVKRLSVGSVQGDIEFKNEVLLVGRLQHKNLVRLLGFCVEGNEKILVYELIENASLDRFLFDSVKRSHLDWDIRFKIIRGIARGLLYLHEDSRFRIIHRDLKASNILLDGDMNPKIADFGLARVFKQDETQGSTSRIVGTFGYMPPEYVIHGLISVKMDVFSFGVLVLEIMSGQKHNSSQNGAIVDLLTRAWENWRQGTPTNAIDPILRGGKDDMLRCIHIGLLCVQEDAAKRPTMASVVLMLGSSTMALPVPSAPAFFGAGSSFPSVSFVLENDSSSNSNVRSGNCQGSSRNDVSATQLYPR